MKIKLNISAAVKDIEGKLAEALGRAKKHRATVIEISYGSHAAGTKKRILNFLRRKEYRNLYNRLEKSKGGWGRIYVHFRWR